MFANRVIPSRALPVLAAALAFLFAPGVLAQAASCTAGNPSASLVQTTPTADFDTSATDGTVIHTKTGLMWKRCAEGQTWDNAASSCTGSTSSLNWQNALAAAKNSTFAGHTDWRLPNVKELQSIVESCGYDPAINTTIFPATPTSTFWSASSFGPSPAYAWDVDFYVGDVFVYDLPYDLQVRLVRGGQSFNSFDLLLGAVTVSKTVTGAAAGSVPAGTNFPITLTCGATVFNANATTTTPAVFTSVPPGSCAVAEGALPTIPGVTWGTPTFAPTQPVSVTAGANPAVTVTNTANITTYAITTAASPVAGGTVSCDTEPVPHGSGSTCTAAANAGYTFADWSGDCTGTGACTLSNVTSAQSVTANFTLNSYTITATANPAAGGTVSCTPNPVNHGDTATCTATANAGYTFGGFSGDCAGASCTLASVTGPRNVTALFTLNNYAIIAAANPAGGGTVSCTPNPVDFGGSSSCTATANAGYTFANWSGDCAGATCALSNVTATRNVTANFTLNSYPITVAASPVAGGTVTCAPNPVNSGGTSSCTATPNAGYTFANWSGDCTGASCTLTNVTSAKSVTANFTAQSNKTFTGPMATGTGNATATVAGGGDTCGFTRSQFVAVSSVPAAPPAGYGFPHGLFDFTLANCPLGGTVTVTITYPSALPAGTVYWKYGPTPGNPSPTWYEMPANIAGNTATFSITDGGLGDDDLTANGGIVDQGGPGAPDAAGTADIPTLSEWAMLVLLSLLLGFSGWRLRRKGAF